ncbi:MAG TPA: 23S rRNA pseudouridine(1911/1915/1917) synthase RluD [Thiothrix sp.]|nr:23S rRNA pseudouridine(1911/1915/1917) synthase RluD [Thiothrix sp.]
MNHSRDHDITDEYRVPASLSQKRLDQAIAALCPDYSRSQLQKWIKVGDIRVNGAIASNKSKVMLDDVISLQTTLAVQTDFQPEAIPLDMVYEDDTLMVINKPANFVVHPAAGNWSGTLVNALLHHNPQLQQLPRAGIVHRLDKDTTGLMVVAKTLTAHQALVQQLQARSVKREYLALVNAVVIAGNTIVGNIGRHPIDRKKMAVLSDAAGKAAITHYRVESRLPLQTLLRVNLETGRTHQIRVHLSHHKLPIVGDKTYGGRLRLAAGMKDNARQLLQHFPRQALHATKLGLIHPQTQQTCQWEVDMPMDMQQLCQSLHDPF